LARLQQAWQTEDFMTAMASGLEGERAFGETCYEQAKRSNEDAVKLFFWEEEFLFPDDGSHRSWWCEMLRRNVYCRIWRFAWLRQYEWRYLKYTQHLIEIARTAAKEKSYGGILSSLEGLEKESLNISFYDKLRFPMASQLPALSVAAKRPLRAEIEQTMTICAIALKRYSLRHGKPPASLDMLVPEFLPSVPIDYMDGKPMKYRLNSDGSFTLYSVGEDGKDDGGDASPSPNSKLGGLWSKRDFIWPSPALPEEIEAYRKEAAKN
jgi:hypothetical protein